MRLTSGPRAKNQGHLCGVPVAIRWHGIPCEKSLLDPTSFPLEAVGKGLNAVGEALSAKIWLAMKPSPTATSPVDEGNGAVNMTGSFADSQIKVVGK